MLYAGEKQANKQKTPHTCVPASSPKYFLPTVETQHQAHPSIFHACNLCPLTPFPTLALSVVIFAV